MGTLYKQQFTKQLPEGAELFEWRGERMARWRDRHGRTRQAPVTTGDDGGTRLIFESAVWSARYRDHDGRIVQQSTGCRDRDAAAQVLAGWEREAERIRAGIATPMEREMSRHRADAIEAHFTAYEAHLEAEGTGKTHRGDTLRYLRRLAEECGFTRLGDLSRSALEAWLAARAREDMSARSRNAYRNALVAFGNWCVEAGRLTTNPVEGAPKADEQVDKRRQRRALTEDELRKLLAVARQRPLQEALTVRRGPRKGERYAEVRPHVRERLERLGRERALLYKTLVLTGLRKNELATLTVGRVVLDGPVPCIDLEARNEKNREGNSVPLRADLADDLRGWLAERLAALQAQARQDGQPVPLRVPADAKLFTVPAALRKILDNDLKAAGIPKNWGAGDMADLTEKSTTT